MMFLPLSPSESVAYGLVFVHFAGHEHGDRQPFFAMDQVVTVQYGTIVGISRFHAECPVNRGLYSMKKSRTRGEY